MIDADLQKCEEIVLAALKALDRGNLNTMKMILAYSRRTEPHFYKEIETPCLGTKSEKWAFYGYIPWELLHQRAPYWNRETKACWQKMVSAEKDGKHPGYQYLKPDSTPDGKKIGFLYTSGHHSHCLLFDVPDRDLTRGIELGFEVDDYSKASPGSKLLPTPEQARFFFGGDRFTGPR